MHSPRIKSTEKFSLKPIVPMKRGNPGDNYVFGVFEKCTSAVSVSYAVFIRATYITVVSSSVTVQAPKAWKSRNLMGRVWRGVPLPTWGWIFTEFVFNFCLQLACVLVQFYRINVSFPRDFSVHCQMTLRKWNNCRPGNDYAGTRERMVPNLHVQP